MKQFVSLLVVLVLCLSAVAFAESVPSKTTGDLTKFEVECENMPADSGFFIRPVVTDEEEYQEKVEICQNEIVKLAESENVVEYFGEVKNAEGEVVDIAALLESDTLNVFEFCPAIAGEYDETYGNVNIKMLFSTPYEKDEKVIVLVGLVTEEEDGTQTVEWIAYEGVGIEIEDAEVEEQGCIQVELDPEIIQAIQDGTALLAVVSGGEIEE